MAETLTAREVAREVGVDVQTIRRWLRSGRLRGVMPGGTKAGYRIPRAEVERLLGLGEATRQ